MENQHTNSPQQDLTWKKRAANFVHSLVLRSERSPLVRSGNNAPNGEPGSRPIDLNDPDSTSKRAKELLLMWKDVFVLAFACFFYNFGYLGFLYNLSSLHVNLGNLANIALTLLTATQVVTSLFLPTLLVNWLGCKRLLNISVGSTIGLSLAQFYPSYATFLPAVIILGIGNICVWVVMGIYVSNIGRAYVGISGDKLDARLGIFYGLVNMIRFSGGLLGNVVPLIIFSIMTTRKREQLHSSDIYLNSTYQSESKNISFCGLKYYNEPIETASNSDTRSQSEILVLYIIYLVIACVGPVLVCFFLNDRKELEEANKIDTTLREQVLASIFVMKDVKVSLLLVSFINAGILRSFATGDFATGFVLCSLKLSSVSLSATISNACYAVLSFLGGLLIRMLSLRVVMLIVSGLCAVSYSYLIGANPLGETGLLSLMIISACMGAAMGSYNTLTNTLIGIICKTNKAGGFSNYRFFYALGSTIGYAWSSSVSMAIKLPVLLAMTVLGIIAYLIVDYKLRKLASEEETQDNTPAIYTLESAKTKL